MCAAVGFVSGFGRRRDGVGSTICEDTEAYERECCLQEAEW